jgi:hypothetical protein
VWSGSGKTAVLEWVKKSAFPAKRARRLFLRFVDTQQKGFWYKTCHDRQVWARRGERSKRAEREGRRDWSLGDLPGNEGGGSREEKRASVR